MSQLLINDLARHTEALRPAVRSAIERVLDSGWYVLGGEGSSFEKEFAVYCGVDHCVGVGNGTDALEIAFRVLGLGPGRRVATVANAGGYTRAALDIVGAIPVYIDVDAESHLMDLEQLERVLGAGETDAIVVTHLFGRMHDLARLRCLADRAGIALIEDCAQAHGARRDGWRAGSVGDVACFSFYPTKNLGALGDAGAVTTKSAEFAARARALRQYGWGSKYRATQAGGRNSRLDEMQAAVLRAKLPHLDGWNARRREIAARYSAGIDDPRIKCPPVQGENYVAHLYVIECEDRDGLRKHLAAWQVVCDVHYPTPDHLQPVAVGSGERSALPVTERLAARVLTLPCFPELQDVEVDRVLELIKAWR